MSMQKKCKIYHDEARRVAMDSEEELLGFYISLSLINQCGMTNGKD
jgi:hypothetical protein